MYISRGYISWAFIIILILSIILTGCDSQGPVSPDKSEMISPKVSQQGTVVQNSNAPFSVLNQGFNHNITPWVDQSVAGPGGWCGTIAHADRRTSDLKPSAGRGFAYLSNGSCNDYYSDIFGANYTSGPASGPNAETGGTSFPNSGFIQELDVYLDPDYPASDDVVFTYANSLCTSCELATYSAVYFAVSALNDGTGLSVAGYDIEKAGWYTLRHVFDSDSEGNLTVDFQLKKNGRLLHQEAINNTFLTSQSTSDLEAASLGSGYIWFVSIADDLQLPVDEHHLRPGK